MMFLTRLQAVSALWLILASLAFIGMVYAFSPIFILLIAWTGGVISYSLFEEVFLKDTKIRRKFHLDK